MQGSAHGGFDFLLMGKEFVEVRFVFGHIRGSQVEVHPGPITVGDAGNRIATDAEKAGNHIVGAGFHAAENPTAKMLFLDDGEGVGPVLKPQIRAGAFGSLAAV